MIVRCRLHSAVKQLVAPVYLISINISMVAGVGRTEESVYQIDLRCASLIGQVQ